MQDSLFHACANDEPQSVDALGHLNNVDIIPLQLQDKPVAQLQFFAQAFSRSADQWFAALMAETPWQQDYLTIAGKTVAIPRLQCWYGDAAYQYSGLRLQPQPWTALLMQIKQQVETLTGHAFNSALINLYRDGNDSVSWHADDEAELGSDPVIASLSLGQSRELAFKAKPPFTDNMAVKPASMKISLTHGSLLVMGTGVQTHFMHGLAKQKHVVKPRINITWRKIYP